jgi:hypothetical protein
MIYKVISAANRVSHYFTMAEALQHCDMYVTNEQKTIAIKELHHKGKSTIASGFVSATIYEVK